MIFTRGVRPMLISMLWGATLPDSALALATTIDDSGTLVRSPGVLMHWRPLSPRRANAAAVAGSTAVQIRLNLTPWLRHTGRIYLVLPAQPPGSIRASWTTQGHLLPGQLTSGERTLVYSGPINVACLQDVLQLSITASAKQIQQTYNVEFRFEMETP